LATRAYDTVVWCLRRLRRDLNFPNVESIAEAEFLVPPPHLVTDEDLRRHCQADVAVERVLLRDVLPEREFYAA
jgi:hypothetical protein